MTALASLFRCEKRSRNGTVMHRLGAYPLRSALVIYGSDTLLRPMCSLASAARSGGIVRQDEIRNARRDLGSKPGAVKHAIMADALLQPVRLAFWWDVNAQPVRGLGLPDPGNVIVFAFDCHQPDAGDLRWINAHAAVGHCAVRQRVPDEDCIDRLQIELRAKVHHREIFIIELAMFLS